MKKYIFIHFVPASLIVCSRNYIDFDMGENHKNISVILK